jgi:indole-3-glycerol phosphate synthase
MSQTTADLLETIVAATRRIVEVRQAREPLATLAARAGAREAAAGRFAAALARTDRVNVIAECKRRSPSRGVLRADYDPAALAMAYAAGGAAAVSVLTEPTFFDGALEHLSAVRAAVDVPILRKDFVVSEYQLFEARAVGADAVLLIVAAFLGGPAVPGGGSGRRLLWDLFARAAELDLDVLVEVHDEREAEAALEGGARIVGVNNRNLRTLEVSVDASERIGVLLPPGTTAVSESGLASRQELERLRALGYQAFLVGEHLVTAPDPGAALRRLL